MERIRQLLRQNPLVGWIFALLIFAVAGLIIFRQNQTQGRFTPASMQEYITIKYMDTGDEERIPRGRVDKMLREQQSGVADSSKGLINPKTGQPTGFPIDKEDWEAWIKRINDDRAEYGSDGVAPKNRPIPPTPPPAPKPGN